MSPISELMAFSYGKPGRERFSFMNLQLIMFRDAITTMERGKLKAQHEGLRQDDDRNEFCDHTILLSNKLGDLCMLLPQTMNADLEHKT